MMIRFLIQLIIQLLLLAVGVGLLVLVVILTCHRFDDVFHIFSAESLLLSNDNDLSTTPTWVSFLGGEFTFSVLLPLGIHILNISMSPMTTMSRSLSMQLASSILIGLLIAHGVVLIYLLTTKETSFEQQQQQQYDTLWNQLKVLVLGLMMLLFVTLVGRGSGVGYSDDDNQQKIADTCSSAADDNNRTTAEKNNHHHHHPSRSFTTVRALVKGNAILQIFTAVMVIGMGLSAVQGPNALLPNLLWEGSGYRYDVVATYGIEQTSSLGFFTLILATMLATIFQSLCLGISTWNAPLESHAIRQSLTWSLISVPLIILANAVTLAIYDRNDDFSNGSHCMVAHILLLVQTNIQTPIVWWVHGCWKRSFNHGTGTIISVNEEGLVKKDKAE